MEINVIRIVDIRDYNYTQLNTNSRCFSLVHDGGNLFIMEMHEESNRPGPGADWF